MSMVLPELPNLFADALNTTPETGALILAFVVLMIVGLVLAVLGMEGHGTVFVLAMTAGVLTAMLWIPLGLFIIGVIVAVAYLIFGGAIGGGRG